MNCDNISAENLNNIVIQKREINTLAIVSLVCALLSIFTTFAAPLLLQIVAIVTGHIARSQIKNNNGKESGSDLALAGLIIGYIMIFLGIGIFIIFGGLIFAFILGAVAL